jgi:four helix bundle protein
MEMEASYRNKNRGYQQLRVWQDSIDFYVACCSGFKDFPYDLRRVTSQGIASADSVHRNIAEGYCRRSVREYMQFLNYALGSLGESVSGLIAYHKAGQLRQTDFGTLNALAFKLENGLLKLVASLERKEMAGDWVDHLVLQESNSAYGANRFSHYSTTPSLQFSWTQSTLKS